MDTQEKPAETLLPVPLVAALDAEPERELGECRRFGCHKPAAEGSRGYCRECVLTVYRPRAGSRHRGARTEPLPQRPHWEYEPQHPEFIPGAEERQ